MKAGIGPIQSEKIQEAIDIANHSVAYAAGAQQGFREIYFMTNPASGNFLALSVWETEADLLASESDGFYREQFAKVGALMAGPPEFDHYELSVEASAGDIDA
ncbi:MAG: hypothetical protein FI724_01175 [SAR202 cluster bacterium]|nr:hypothetical protein [SAR202 cluster bacterium]